MRIIVSLTTIPSRAQYLSKIVECLNDQTHPIDKVYINLPYRSIRENSEYPDPNPLPNSSIPIEIIRCSDYGPITKLYPVLQYEKDPETLIITLDDDIQYVSERIETLVKWAEKYPGAAMGGSGFIMGEWWNFFGTVRQPERITPVSVLEGYSGCVYRRKFFDYDLIDYAGAPKEAFYHDDVWISGYLARKGILRLVHPRTSDSPSKLGNSGYGAEQHLPNGLSYDLINFICKIIPILMYWRQQGLFMERQTVVPIRTFGFWFLVLVLFILILITYFLIKPWR